MGRFNFNVGDRVTIRSDLIGDNYYSGLYFNPKMSMYRGRSAVITGKNYSGSYFLSITDRSWAWNDDMLLPYNSDKPLLLPGHEVIVNGIISTIIDISSKGYSLNNQPSVYSEKEISLIDGLDYSVPPEEIVEGDIVMCRVGENLCRYNNLLVARPMSHYYGQVAKVTAVKSNGRFEISTVPLTGVESGVEEWTWNNVTCKKITFPTEFSEGDIVRQVSFYGKLCAYKNGEFVGSHPQNNPIFEKTTSNTVILKTDIFSVGKKGDAVVVYRGDITGSISVSNAKTIVNTLFEGEYQEV